MIEELSCNESRITIFNKPFLCYVCEHDVFIPYSTHHNVENPGIDVYFVNYTAICMYCGGVSQFGDPSYFNPDGVYIWAFDQFLINPTAPKEPIIRIVDEDTRQAQNRCIQVALHLLYQEKKITASVFELAFNEQYKQIVQLFEGNTDGENVENVSAEKCIGILLSKLTTYGVLDHDQLYPIIVEESYAGIESFLYKHIVNERD